MKALQSYEYLSDTNYKQKKKAKCLSCIGNLYEQISEIDKACDYLQKAIDISIDIYSCLEKYDYKDMISRHHHLGELYRCNGKNLEALKEYHAEKVIREKHVSKDSERLVECCFKIACTYNALKESMKAIEYLNEALKYCQDKNTPYNEKMKKKINRTMECVSKK